MILDTFTIETQDSIATAHDKLAQQVYAKPLLGLRGSFLFGEVSEDFFWLRRFEVRGGGTFFRAELSLTIITGWFETVPTGTVIHLTVEVNMYCLLVYLPFLLVFIATGWQSLLNKVDGAIFVSVILIVMPIICTIFSSKDEMRFYRNKLRQIFL
jgi:hypothetical protein